MAVLRGDEGSVSWSGAEAEGSVIVTICAAGSAFEAGVEVTASVNGADVGAATASLGRGFTGSRVR